MEHGKILIIDRDDATATSLQLPLDAEGYEVFRAVNANEGLALLKQIQPDLIILDALTDSTAEGVRVSMALRNPTPSSEYGGFHHIPIIMLTAIHSGNALRLEPEKDFLASDSLIEKSVAPEKLLEEVKRRLAVHA